MNGTRKSLRFAVFVIFVFAFIAGGALRKKFGIEFTPQSIKIWIESLGWEAYFMYVGLLIIRPFLLLPIAIVLAAGGLCFGVVAGTILGSMGILFSFLINFAVARIFRRGWIKKRIEDRFKGIVQRFDSSGPFIVGVTTAYPIGPMSPFHLAAGLSSISLTSFLIPVVIGGPIRAWSYSFFGSTLLNLGSREFYLSSLVLIILILIPLIHPSIRKRIPLVNKLSWKTFRFENE